MANAVAETPTKRKWQWRPRSIWWKIIPGTAIGLALLTEAFLILTGNRLLYRQIVVMPGTSYLSHSYGEVGKQPRTRLICHYFTGLSTQTQLVWYDPANSQGLDECPFIADQSPLGQALTSSNRGSSIADWAGVWAVIVAAVGYFTVELHRWKENRKRDQDIAYQIVSKVGLLLNDAQATLTSLTPNGYTAQQLQAITSPFQIVGMQQPVVGFSTPMTQNLSDDERNLLLRLREEEFMMDFTECFAQNASIRDGIMEYTQRYEALQAFMPPVIESKTGHQIREYQNYESMSEAYPHFYTAASLIKNLRKMALRNVSMMTDVAQRYQPLMEKHFPNLHIHKIDLVDAEQDTDEELAQLVIDPLPPKQAPRRVRVTVTYS